MKLTAKHFADIVSGVFGDERQSKMHTIHPLILLLQALDTGEIGQNFKTTLAKQTSSLIHPCFSCKTWLNCHEHARNTVLHFLWFIHGNPSRSFFMLQIQIA